jgi:hypothetical protein
MKTKCTVTFYELNLNENVYVKLNEAGLVIYQKYWNEVSFLTEVPKADEQGYHKFQLWVLMSIFGPSLSCGMIVPFEEAEIMVRVTE